MSKYIDAERLRMEVKRLEKTAHKAALGCADSETRKFHEGKDAAYQRVGILIFSLQQDQLVNNDLGTLITCDIIEMTAKKAIDKPQDKEKEEELMTRKINYLISLEENYVQQEQPEMDLEEAAAAIILKKHPIMKDAFTMEMAFYEMLELVKAGYELGLNARKDDK